MCECERWKLEKDCKLHYDGSVRCLVWSQVELVSVLKWGPDLLEVVNKARCASLPIGTTCANTSSVNRCKIYSTTVNVYRRAISFYDLFISLVPRCFVYLSASFSFAHIFVASSGISLSRTTAISILSHTCVRQQFKALFYVFFHCLGTHTCNVLLTAEFCWLGTYVTTTRCRTIRLRGCSSFQRSQRQGWFFCFRSDLHRYLSTNKCSKASAENRTSLDISFVFIANNFCWSVQCANEGDLSI